MGTIFQKIRVLFESNRSYKDEQKRALPLHVAGEEVQDIIETLDNTALSDFRNFLFRVSIQLIKKKT
jgi:hypothetical protein